MADMDVFDSSDEAEAAMIQRDFDKRMQKLEKFGLRGVNEEEVQEALQVAFDEGYSRAYKVAFRFNALRARVMILRGRKDDEEGERDENDKIDKFFEKINGVYEKLPSVIREMKQEDDLSKLVDVESLEVEAKQLGL